MVRSVSPRAQDPDVPDYGGWKELSSGQQTQIFTLPKPNNWASPRRVPVKFYVFVDGRWGVGNELGQHLKQCIKHHGGTVVSNPKDANTVIVKDQPSVIALQNTYDLRSLSRTIYVELPGFIKERIQCGTYRHHNPPQRGMGGRPTGRRPRTEYTPEDEDILCRFLAMKIPNKKAGGRQGKGLYVQLEQLSKIDPGKPPRHTWQSWKEHYKMNQDRLDLKINEIVQQKPELLTGPQRYSLTRIPDAMNVSEGSGDEHGDGEQSIDDVEAQVNPKHEREEEEEESEEDVMEPGRQEQRDTESMDSDSDSDSDDDLIPRGMKPAIARVLPRPSTSHSSSHAQKRDHEESEGQRATQAPMSSQVTLVATQNHSRVPLNRNRLQEKGKARETRIPTQEPTDESSHEMDVDINEQDEVMDVLQGMNTPDTSQQKSFHDSDQEAEERASPLVGPIQNSPRGSGYGSDDMQADLKIFGRDQRRGERSMPSTQEAASRAAGDRDGLRATRAPKRARRTFPGASKPAYAPEPPPSLLRNKRSPPQRNDESSDSESSVDVDTIPFLNTGKGQPQQRALQDPVDVPYVPPLGSRAAQYFKKRKV